MTDGILSVALLDVEKCFLVCWMWCTLIYFFKLCALTISYLVEMAVLTWQSPITQVFEQIRHMNATTIPTIICINLSYFNAIYINL